MPNRMNDVIVLLRLEESIADLHSRWREEEKKKIFISSKVLPRSFNMCRSDCYNISRVTYQANHNENASKWQIKRQVLLWWVKLFLFAAFHAPARRYNANARKCWRQKHPQRLFIQLGPKCQQNCSEHVKKGNERRPNICHGNERYLDD